MEFSHVKAKHNFTEKINLEQFKMHTHDTYEIYCFLHGEAHYSVEGAVYPLESGDIILMRKGESHYLMPNPNIAYERICVNFDFKNLDDDYFSKNLLKIFNDRPLGKFNRYPAELFQKGESVYYLKKICNANNNNARMIYIQALLQELYEKFEIIKFDDGYSFNDNSRDVLRYINRHLNENITLDMLCEKFFISKSQLNRNFKRSNGSTVWEYITVKRLLLAKENLKNGIRPTEVFTQCGFNDYVSFYKAYKKHFGVSPKNDFKNN